MSTPLPAAPAPPGFEVPWHDLLQFPWVRALEACPQDPVHHAEGNVLIHTRMVLEELAAMPAYRALGDEEREVAFLSCLLHDVAKPATTRTEEDGRVTAKGHSKRGELMARRILWEAEVPFARREAVCGLVRAHQVPFFLIDRDDAALVASQISVVTRCDLLAMVAEADMRGRVCRDAQKALDNVELFRELCEELGCLRGPRPFASDHTRVAYFRDPSRVPEVPVFDDTRVTVTLMSGLPGAGKDTTVKTSLAGLPVVSLDGLRRELDVEHGDNQGPVVFAAREQAREHLRRGEPFVWNATNLTRQVRSGLVSLFHDYKARVRIVYVEAGPRLLFEQNKSRDAVVPERAIRRMIERWEVPDLTEAHEVSWLVR